MTSVAVLRPEFMLAALPDSCVKTHCLPIPEQYAPCAADKLAPSSQMKGTDRSKLRRDT